MKNQPEEKNALEIRELAFEELEQVVGGGWVIAGDVSSTAATATFKQDRPIRNFARQI